MFALIVTHLIHEEKSCQPYQLYISSVKSESLCSIKKLKSYLIGLFLQGSGFYLQSFLQVRNRYQNKGITCRLIHKKVFRGGASLCLVLSLSLSVIISLDLCHSTPSSTARICAFYQTI